MAKYTEYRRAEFRQGISWLKISARIGGLKQKKKPMFPSYIKTMLICFFLHKGIVHFEFIKQGQTVNQYCYILTRLWDAICKKHPELWPNYWLLYCDNAPAHVALTFRCFWLKNVSKLNHPSYWPDLAPSDFWKLIREVNFLIFWKCFDQWQHSMASQGEYFG